MIRKAVLGDLESIVSMEQTFGAEAFSKRSLRHFILSKNLVLVFIDPDTKCRIAYCIVLLRSDTSKAKLYSITVAEEARGRGIGRKMLEACEQYSRNFGRTEITLEVRANNQTAINLYQTFGFKFVKTLQSYYGDNQDGYYMKKAVDISLQ